ncbi:hypothetical protein OUZ56_011314 [Daphnia magna]|uniref:Uncharacterized protein n=1 Tax=Daphnia magna TaxID=35525 RepID=A0ABQ9Z015_9CRUS|nr:hypothetical protein OUZ56_011314 [Daphnia magna]
MIRFLATVVAVEQQNNVKRVVSFAEAFSVRWRVSRNIYTTSATNEASNRFSEFSALKRRTHILCNPSRKKCVGYTWWTMKEGWREVCDLIDPACINRRIMGVVPDDERRSSAQLSADSFQIHKNSELLVLKLSRSLQCEN